MPPSNPIPPSPIGTERTIGPWGATGIGVGAIVGGGVLALAGTAYAATGPSAVLAFAANGVIALLTALTFAEMATSFPESGGTYTFAKKVFTVEAAFMVGWVVWFASIVATVLYALGFGAFARIFLVELFGALGATVPAWASGGGIETVLGLAATAFYAVNLLRRSGGGGSWETLGKVVVFAILIAGGAWSLATRPAGGSLSPFFAEGGAGLLRAMGYTFIALQGFDLIAAVAGKIDDPRRVIPRAMVGSLGIALAVYVPLLLIVATAGVPSGSDITALGRADPEGVVVAAVRNYLGPVGLWLVIVAALLSMLSALQANLLAASHIALAMARDRNLPLRLAMLHPERGTPAAAVVVTTATATLLLLAIPDVAVAGAVSSLIFLLSFALTHWTSILARRRGGGREDALKLPLFPLVPVLGGGCCVGLALFQGVAVPAAGLLGLTWLAMGGGLYWTVFSRRARVADAAAEAFDPQLARLRGRNPLVLVPIANPASAAPLVALASALAPPRSGRVLLLSVVRTPESWQPSVVPPQLTYAQEVLGEALTASFASRLSPEALVTISPEPWDEIVRVARVHRCESLLLGLGSFEEEDEARALSLQRHLLRIDADLVLARVPRTWTPGAIRRVLVPVGGRRDQSSLRARLLGALSRVGDLEVLYLGIVPSSGGGAASEAADALRGAIGRLAEDECPGRFRAEVRAGADIGALVVEEAARCDLVILGMRRPRRSDDLDAADARLIGRIPRRVARETDCAIVMLGGG